MNLPISPLFYEYIELVVDGDTVQRHIILGIEGPFRLVTANDMLVRTGGQFMQVTISYMELEQKVGVEWRKRILESWSVL